MSVGNGREAIDAIQTQHFDFIITDIIMPELDGWEVLKMTRQVQPSPKVIIITAHGKEDTKIMARKRGALAYVEKPYIINEIKEILKTKS